MLRGLQSSILFLHTIGGSQVFYLSYFPLTCFLNFTFSNGLLSAIEASYPTMTNSPLKGVYVAASPLCTSPSGENAGDGVFASENYEPGTQITSLPRPMIGALDDERLPEVCANCFKWVVWEASNADDEEEAEKIRKSMLKCGGCKRMRYCGKVGFSSPFFPERIGNTGICFLHWIM